MIILALAAAIGGLLAVGLPGRCGMPQIFGASAKAIFSGKATLQAFPSVLAIVVGVLSYYRLGRPNLGASLIYFGAQTGMNLYMKSVLSKIVVDAEAGLVGLPIGFLMTVIQQLVALALVYGFVLLSRFHPQGGYEPRKLRTTKEKLVLLIFSLTFAMNIGLNNFSLSLLAISTQQTIRSCMPLTTAITQVVLGARAGGLATRPSLQEWFFMVLGVSCAAFGVFVRTAGGDAMVENTSVRLGVCCAIFSTFSGALNMVLAGVLGASLKLNPLDTTFYMALPASVILLLPAVLVPHPMTNWRGFTSMTDMQVLEEVLVRDAYKLFPVFLSGVFAFIYNVVQYWLVQKQTATYTTFAGNFNIAATVMLSLLLGLETLPEGRRYAYLAAVVGNMAAFFLYSKAKQRKSAKLLK